MTDENRLAKDSPFRVPVGFLAAFFAFAAVVGCVDFYFPDFSYRSRENDATFFYVLFFILIASDRERPILKRLVVTALAILAAVGYGLLLHRLHPHITTGLLMERLFSNRALYFTIGTIWLASPLVLNRHARYGAWLRAAGLLVLLFFLLRFASILSSRYTARSFNDFTSEQALLVAFLFSWLRAAHHDPRVRRLSGTFFLYGLGILVVAGTGIGLLDLWGGETLRERLAAWSFIHVEQPGAEDFLPQRRLTFPRRIFNQTSYLGIAALFMFLISLFRVEKRRRRGCEWLALITVAAAFCVLYFSSTRSALVFGIGGLGLWLLLSIRVRWALPAIVGLAAAGVILILLMPAPKRTFFVDAFKPAMYATEGPMTSMQERFLGWHWGVEVVRRFPLSGYGYGTRNIERIYNKYLESEEADSRLRVQRLAGRDFQHLHNLWVQTAAESGLPAAAALLAFCLLRWTMLIRAWQTTRGGTRRRLAGWIALECVLFLLGMLFYMFRYNFGYFTWAIWIYALSEANEVLSEKQAKA
ncbi:O-antigen ligase family protein [bacterium]|nr:O-antigen ligase family protein [bacterium]